MPCYFPLVAHRKASGGVVVTRAKSKGEPECGEFVVPCGQCIGCRNDRAKMWATRCVHEERMNRENGNESSFLTLTYQDRNLPPDGGLCPNDHKEFINKLKLKLWRNDRKMRYYMCGEYGEKFQRPHYHYLIFGYDFPDKKKWSVYRGQQYYRSEELEKLWTYGNSLIGHVTVESAGYCARYVMKKQTGKKAGTHYVNDNGVVLHPEFSRMSLKPGIGAEWFRKYGYSDVYDSGDFILIAGKKYSTPRYYDTLLERLDVERLFNVKSDRRRNAAAHAFNNTTERLLTREECHRRSISRLKRGYENGQQNEEY